jgi:hypothetical protein
VRLKKTSNRKKLKPSKNQNVSPRFSIPSARKERQKYTSNVYRKNYDRIFADK